MNLPRGLLERTDNAAICCRSSAIWSIKLFSIVSDIGAVAALDVAATIGMGGAIGATAVAAMTGCVSLSSILSAHVASLSRSESSNTANITCVFAGSLCSHRVLSMLSDTSVPASVRISLRSADGVLSPSSMSPMRVRSCFSNECVNRWISAFFSLLYLSAAGGFSTMSDTATIVCSSKCLITALYFVSSDFTLYVVISLSSWENQSFGWFLQKAGILTLRNSCAFTSAVCSRSRSISRFVSALGCCISGVHVDRSSARVGDLSMGMDSSSSFTFFTWVPSTALHCTGTWFPSLYYAATWFSLSHYTATWSSLLHATNSASPRIFLLIFAIHCYIIVAFSSSKITDFASLRFELPRFDSPRGVLCSRSLVRGTVTWFFFVVT